MDKFREANAWIKAGGKKKVITFLETSKDRGKRGEKSLAFTGALRTGAGAEERAEL